MPKSQDMTQEFLLELYSEEIPARMQARAAEDLERLILERLRAAGLPDALGRNRLVLSTSRRLTLAIRDLPAALPSVTEERKGPRVGSPEGAIQGFLKAAGVASLDACEQRDSGKGVFWFAVRTRPGRGMAEVLAETIPAVLADFPWPKSMRWASGSVRWVRPLHSILALFNGEPLKGSFALGGDLEPVVFGNTTRGHRFLAPQLVTITGIEDYLARLQAAFVRPSRAEREAKIVADATALAEKEGCALVPDSGLVAEVVGLAEWPTLLMGRIDETFMDVPKEVLVTSMRTHQKYFAAAGPDGSLAPRFIVVADMVTRDGGQAVVAGNERVLRARLSDAKFFWDQDRKVRLADRVSALADITFHARLGTVAAKIERMSALAKALAARIPGADPEAAARAAHLAKADLVSGVVGEFPELQGIMGRYYALHDGEPAAVADGVADHYKPLGPSDSCPRAPVSVATALADKLDTLIGFFAIGEKPTGSKDPYALRRAALGVIRLVVENGLRLPLREAFRTAHGLYAVSGLADAETVAGQLLEFFADRLMVVLRDKGIRHDLIAAVFALGGEDDLVRLLARVEALQAFIGSDDGANLLTAYRRAANIVRIEEKKDGRAYTEAPDASRLQESEEKALVAALAAAEEAVRPALAGENFAAAMSAMAGLRQPVDAFFEKVTVNADDPTLRVNRLCLLNRIRATLDAVADFTRIEG